MLFLVFTVSEQQQGEELKASPTATTLKLKSLPTVCSHIYLRVNLSAAKL